MCFVVFFMSLARKPSDLERVDVESLVGKKIYAATKNDSYVLRGSVFDNGQDYVFVYSYRNGGGGILIPKDGTLMKVGRNMYYIKEKN